MSNMAYSCTGAGAPGTLEGLWLAPGVLKINTSLTAQLGLASFQAKTGSCRCPGCGKHCDEGACGCVAIQCPVPLTMPRGATQLCPTVLTLGTQLLQSARHPSSAQPSTCSHRGSAVMLPAPLAPRRHPDTQTPFLAPMGSPCYLLLSPRIETNSSAGTRSRFLEQPRVKTQNTSKPRALT